jgi:hypothetical protein
VEIGFDAVGVNQYLGHHSRMIGRLTVVVFFGYYFNCRKIQMVNYINDKVHQVVFRKQISKTRQQQKHLIGSHSCPNYPMRFPIWTAIDAAASQYSSFGNLKSARISRSFVINGLARPKCHFGANLDSSDREYKDGMFMP